MTKFQAVFVLWLRHEKFQSCSWRALHARYNNRYNEDGTLKSFKERKVFNTFIEGGNQIMGMKLEEKAFKILRPLNLFKETINLFDCDLTSLDVNIKNNIK